MLKKPLIGLSSSIISDVSGEFAKYPRTYVNKDYVDGVMENGGIPLVIPMSEKREMIREYIDLIDGLILSGGHDVCPWNYGEEPREKLGEVFPERDSYDFLLLEEAKNKGIPILGICRGHQVINVFHGGTLEQDLSYIESEKEILKHNQEYNYNTKTHRINIKENTKLFEIFKENEIMVNSFHHQVVKKMGNGLVVSAKAKDGVIEAIELENYPFLLGVQWHPEMLFKKYEDMNLIFKKLVEVSREYKG